MAGGGEERLAQGYAREDRLCGDGRWRGKLEAAVAAAVAAASAVAVAVGAVAGAATTAAAAEAVAASAELQMPELAPRRMLSWKCSVCHGRIWIMNMPIIYLS